MNLKDILKSIAFESAFTFLILLISLRTYIFGNGFFDYADQYWNPSFYSTNFVSLSPFSNHEFVGVLAFSRSVIVFPAELLNSIIYSQILSEKVFILYTFVLFIALSFLFAELLYRYLSNNVNLPQTFLKKEFLKLVVVVIIFSNLAIINLNVDGGTWADGIIMLLIVISFLLIQIDGRILRVVMYDATMISISLMLDPDYYLIFMLAIFLGFILSKNVNGIKRILYPSIVALLSFPTLFYIIFGIIITSTGVSNPLAGRAILSAFGDININVVTSLLLIGHSWSFLSFAPPSIISCMGKNIEVPFYGDMVILPLNAISFLWIITLSLYPVIAFISIRLSKVRTVTVPFLFLLLLSLFLSQWFKIPIISMLFIDATKIPLIGSAIGTTLALPSHYMNPEGISEAVLISVLFLYVWGQTDIIKEFSKRDFYLIIIISVSFISYVFYVVLNNYFIDSMVLIYLTSISSIVAILYYFFSYLISKPYVNNIVKRVKTLGKAENRKVVISFMIIFIVLFTGWQAFNGSYFPQRSFNGTSQNPLSSKDGPYSPVNIPSYVISQYENLSKNSTYHTVFFAPQMPNNLDGEYMGIYLNYLIDNNYTTSLKPFMTYENIRYLITYKDSSTIDDALNSSSLNIRYLGPGSYLYSDNDALGNSYKANILLNYTGGSSIYSTIDGILPQVGLIPVVSDVGKNTLGFNSMNDTVNVISPLYLRSFSPLNQSVNIISILKHNQNFSLASNRDNLIQNLWYVQDSGNSTVINIQNRSIEWNLQRNINLTINYGSPGPGGYIVIPIQDYKYAETVAKISFRYKTTNYFSGKIIAGFNYIYNSSTGIKAAYQPISSYNKSTDCSWINETVNFAFPPMTGWFSPELSFKGIAGKIYITNMNVSWMSVYDMNSKNFISSPVYMGNAKIVTPINGRYYLKISGNGSLNDITIHSHLKWYLFRGKTFDFTGNLTVINVVFIRAQIKSILGNFTVYNYPFSKMVRIETDGEMIKPNYTLEGQMFYGGYHLRSNIVLLDSVIILYGYVALIVYILILIALPILFYRKKSRKNRKF